MSKRWKRLAWVALVLGLVAGGVHWKQAEIGQAVFERAAKARAGRDVTKSLPDGLHVGLCGTGSPLPSADRAGACTLVIAGKRLFVVDAGEGGARNMALMGIPSARLERLFLTHFHSDHIDGLGPMMLLRWTGSAARTPLPIHGPTGVEQLVAGFNMAYAADNGYRVAHHGAAIVPPEGGGAQAFPFTMPEDGAPLVVLDDGGVRVTAFTVDHDPVKPAIGYRFDYQGRSVVISGDTAKSDSVARIAKGADLLVHEALQPALVKALTAATEANGLPNTAKITRDILDYHASPEEAADTAKAAGVQHLVLTHIVPPYPSRFFEPAFLRDSRARFSGKLTVGRDGMLISLPAGSKSETVQSLF